MCYERTLFKNVKQVPPGHYYEFLEMNKGERILVLQNVDERDINLKDAIELLDITFKNSIKSQLMSDVL